MNTEDIAAELYELRNLISDLLSRSDMLDDRITDMVCTDEKRAAEFDELRKSIDISALDPGELVVRVRDLSMKLEEALQDANSLRP